MSYFLLAKVDVTDHEVATPTCLAPTACMRSQWQLERLEAAGSLCSSEVRPVSWTESLLWDQRAAAELRSSEGRCCCIQTIHLLQEVWQEPPCPLL